MPYHICRVCNAVFKNSYKGNSPTCSACIVDRKIYDDYVSNFNRVHFHNNCSKEYEYDRCEYSFESTLENLDDDYDLCKVREMDY